MVGEDCSQSHRSTMQHGLLAETAQAGVAMDDLDAFPQDDISKKGEKGENGGEGGRAVDDGKRTMVDLDAIGQVAYPLPILVGVSYDNDLVSSVDQLAGELVDVAFDSSWLGEEEIANHSDIIGSVRHRVG